MNVFHQLAVAAPIFLTFYCSAPCAVGQVITKSSYVTNIDGNKFFVTDFQRKSSVILSYQLSTNLTNWGPPGTGGRPGISTSVSSDDILVTSVRINQPITAFNRYFLRALYEIKRRPRLDFDGDGKTDFVLARNTGGGPSGAISWLMALSGGGTRTVVHGIASDFFTPGDFDGDGLCDLAVWRTSTATFLIIQSSNGVTRSVALGQPGDQASVIADYDGDGKTDPAIFRSSITGNRFIYIGSDNNPTQSPTTVLIGTTSGFPNPGDYDGDFKADCCVQVDSGGGNADFIIRRSADNVTETVPFGKSTDVTSSGDFDGDGKDDIITIRGVSGAINWNILERDGGGTGVTPIILGVSSTDFQCAGDYDGDGKTDIAIWSPSATPGQSNFKVRRSSDGTTTTFNFGNTGDYPVANTYTH